MNYSHAIDKTVKDLLKATRRYFAKQTYLYGGGKVEFRRLPSEQYESVMEIYLSAAVRTIFLNCLLRSSLTLRPQTLRTYPQ